MVNQTCFRVIDVFHPQACDSRIMYVSWQVYCWRTGQMRSESSIGLLASNHTVQYTLLNRKQITTKSVTIHHEHHELRSNLPSN